MTITSAAGISQAVTVTPVANGEYSITYTLTQGGLYTMAIKVQPNGVGSFYPLATSPFSISCIVSSTSPANTVLSGAGLTSAVAGDLAQFLVTLFDSGNNQRTSGGDNVAVSITSASANVSLIQVIDNNNGTYTVNYLATDATAYTITVVVNGAVASAKTSALTVVANIPTPYVSVLSAISPITIEASNTYTVNALDAWNNIVQTP